MRDDAVPLGKGLKEKMWPRNEVRARRGGDLVDPTLALFASTEASATNDSEHLRAWCANKENVPFHHQRILTTTFREIVDR